MHLSYDKRRTETNSPPEPHVVAEIEGVFGLKAIRPCGTVLQYSAKLAKGFWNCRCMYMDVLRGLRILLFWLGFHKTEQQLQSWSVWKVSVGGRPTSTRSIRSSSMRKFGPLPFSLTTSSNLHFTEIDHRDSRDRKKALGLHMHVHGRGVGPEVYDSFCFGQAFTTGRGCDTAINGWSFSLLSL